MVIGTRLRELREQKKLSQGDITEMIGLPRSYISRIENGHALPSLETLQRMAAALDVPLYRLFYSGTDAPNGRPTGREQVAQEAGPSGVEARFLMEMRGLTKNLRRPERVFLLNLAGRLAARKSNAEVTDRRREPHPGKRRSPARRSGLKGEN